MESWSSRLVLALLVIFLVPRAAAADPVERVLATHQVRPDVSVLHVVKNGDKDIGVAVEWRGEALDVVKGQFTLQEGPYKVVVHTGSLKYQLAAGEPVRIIARVTAAGNTPVVDALLVAPGEVHTIKGLGWHPNVVTQEEANVLIPRWHKWILSFNHHLEPDTAGMYLGTVEQYSHPIGLDPRFVLCVVAAESAFQKDAVSPVGAIGLGQLMPDTAVSLGVVDIHDPRQNLQGCIRLLGIEMRRWQHLPDQYQRVLASYNAGEGAVVQYNGVPPYAETRAYVTYILSLYHELAGL